MPGDTGLASTPPGGKPPRFVRLYFWFLLSALSVFFAEVIAGSSPTGLYSFWGIVVLLPLYGLHVLLLAALAYRTGPPRLVTLYAAGAVLGLYEAYITKMLWHPTWGDQQWPVAGISLFAFLQLILFWHPLMAFIVPVLVAAASVRDGGAILPSRVRRWLASRPAMVRASLIAGAACGLFTANGGRPLFGLLNGLTVAALLFLWQRINRWWDPAMQDLLPRGWELVVLGAVLALYFVTFGIKLRPEALAGFEGQATAWLLYAFYLWLTVRTSRTPSPIGDDSPPRLAPEMLAYFALAMAASGTILCAIPHGFIVGMVIFSLAGWIVGARLLASTVRQALISPAAAAEDAGCRFTT